MHGSFGAQKGSSGIDGPTCERHARERVKVLGLRLVIDVPHTHLQTTLPALRLTHRAAAALKCMLVWARHVEVGKFVVGSHYVHGCDHMIGQSAFHKIAKAICRKQCVCEHL